MYMSERKKQITCRYRKATNAAFSYKKGRNETRLSRVG